MPCPSGADGPGRPSAGRRQAADASAPLRASLMSRVTSAPSMVSCSSSARATRSRPCGAPEGHPAAVLLLAEDALDLLVDHPGGLVGVVAGVHEVLAQEHLALEPHAIGPTRVVMPHSLTILRASSVEPTRSLLAPVEMTPNTSSSAMRPPMRTTRLSSM